MTGCVTISCLTLGKIKEAFNLIEIKIIYSFVFSLNKIIRRYMRTSSII